MALKPKTQMKRMMKNNRMNNDSHLGVLKKIMRQKLGEIKQSRNQNKSNKQNRRKNEHTRQSTKTKKSTSQK